MKRKKYIIYTFIFFIISYLLLVSMNRSYSYGLTMNIEGSKGSRKLIYQDSDTGTKISIEDAIKYYNIPEYTKIIEGNNYIYFYRGNETTKNNFEKGEAAEQADRRAKQYGPSAYRVKSTNEFKRALDDIYRNLKIGEVYIEFSPYDAIDWTEITNYYNNHYGLITPYQNYYNYQTKGELEPNRFSLNLESSKEEGELLIDSSNIRISSNEKIVAETFVQKILPLMEGNGTDYEHILAAYSYITQNTTYLVDDGFINDMLASNTSIYDVFINQKSVCIGYSIAFSYLMDKMGIESYIVDNITHVDPINNTFASTHTYNIVKLENKFYKIDLTGKIFLNGLSSSELYDKKLPISSGKYNTNGKKTTYSFDKNKIMKYLNEAKQTSTTTTKKRNTTTTTRKNIQYNFTTKNNNPKATTKKNSAPTTYKEEVTNTTSTTIITNSTKTNEQENSQEKSTEKQTTKHYQVKKKKKNLNYILIGLAVLVIILYVIYKKFLSE